MDKLDTWESLPTGKPLKTRILSSMRRAGYPTPRHLVKEIKANGVYEMGNYAVPNRGYVRNLGKKGWLEVWSFLRSQGFDYSQSGFLPQPELVPQFYLALAQKIDELIELLRKSQASIVPPAH